MQVETASDTRPSPSKRLYSERRIPADENEDNNREPQEFVNNVKIARGTELMFEAREFLNKLEARAEITVSAAKHTFQEHLDKIFDQDSYDTKKKLACQFEYCFVHGFKEKFEKYKNWVLLSGEFEVPAQFSNSRSNSPVHQPSVTTETLMIKEPVSYATVGHGQADLKKAISSAPPEVTRERVAEVREEAVKVAKNLKDLQSARKQVAASIARKKLEYLTAYASLCQHRVYSNALQSPAAFCDSPMKTHKTLVTPLNNGDAMACQNNTTSRRGGRASISVLEPKPRLPQVLEVSEAIGNLREAIKTRQLLGSQLEGLSPLFPQLEATPLPSNSILVQRDTENRLLSRHNFSGLASVSRAAGSCRPSAKKDHHDMLCTLQSPETIIESNIVPPMTQAESRAMTLDLFSDLVEHDMSKFAV